MYICIDTAWLKYWITFHEAEFGIVGGYYLNSGRNNIIYNVIKSLYDLRPKRKKEIIQQRWLSNY